MIAHCRHAPLQAGHPVRRGLLVNHKRLWDSWIASAEPGDDTQ